MRATEKKLRDRHARLPEQYKKVDTTVNGDAENLIEERKQLEKNLVPLRLSNTTVIYVTKDKQNEAYAAVARKAFVDPLSQENITKMYKEDGISPRRMAEILNVSVRTVYLRLAKYGLTKVKCR